MIRHNGISLYPSLRVIEHRGGQWKLPTRSVYRVAEHLILQPDTLENILCRIHRGDRDGGPASWTKLVRVHLDRWRKEHFPRMQLRIVKVPAGQGYWHKRYGIEPDVA